jgi:histone acetyltransferase (RNA polymerase elongator complex component)
MTVETDPDEIDAEKISEMISSLTEHLQQGIQNWLEEIDDEETSDEVVRLMILQSSAYYLGYSKASCVDAKIQEVAIEQSIEKFEACGEQDYKTFTGISIPRDQLN